MGTKVGSGFKKKPGFAAAKKYSGSIQTKGASGGGGGDGSSPVHADRGDKRSLLPFIGQLSVSLF